MNTDFLTDCGMDNDFDLILDTISDIVEQYESGAYLAEGNLAELHRRMTANLYYLTKFQVDYREQWQAAYHNSPEKSSIGKERVADKLVPELYMCRKLYEAGKGVAIAMGYDLKIMRDEA